MSKIDKNFNPVFDDSAIFKYKGKILKNSKNYYLLLCYRITPRIGKALLAEGFRGVGKGITPTHVIYTVVFLFRDSGKPRCLFNIFLCLENIKNNHWQDWVAEQISKGLKRDLINCKDLGFLIRCRRSNEFHFCLDDEEIEFFWIQNCGIWYSYAIRQLPPTVQIVDQKNSESN